MQESQRYEPENRDRQNRIEITGKRYTSEDSTSSGGGYTSEGNVEVQKRDMGNIKLNAGESNTSERSAEVNIPLSTETDKGKDGNKFSSENYLSDARISPDDTSERSTEVNIQLNAETKTPASGNKIDEGKSEAIKEARANCFGGNDRTNCVDTDPLSGTQIDVSRINFDANKKFAAGKETCGNIALLELWKFIFHPLPLKLELFLEILANLPLNFVTPC